MPLDLTLVLYWSSLGISAAAVVLFLWLMRERRAEGGRRKAGGERPPFKNGSVR
jgi:hypothetical protein